MAVISELRNLHADLKLRYGAKWTDDENRSCARLLEELAKDFGHAALSRGVAEYRKTASFFNENELRATIQRVKPPSERSYCDRCRDSEGWIYIMCEGEKGWRVYRCIHDVPLAVRMVTIREKISGEMRVLKAVDCDYADSQPVGAYRDPSEAGA